MAGIPVGAKLYYKFEENNFDQKISELLRELGTIINPPTSLKETIVPLIEAPAPVKTPTLAAIQTQTLPSIPIDNPVKKWDVKEVVGWLDKQNTVLADFKEFFEEEMITGDALIELAAFASKEDMPTVLTFLKETFEGRKIGQYLTLIQALKQLILKS